MSDEDDPFEHLDAPDEDGDPFEHLDRPDPAGDEGDADGHDDADGDADHGADPRSTGDAPRSDDPGGSPPGRLEDDPFDRHDAGRSPAGPDPEHGAAGHDRAGGGDGTETPDVDAADIAGDADVVTGAGSDVDDDVVAGLVDDGPETAGDEDDPFDQFERQAPATGAESDPFEAFEEVDTGGLDPDDVWESLSAAEKREFADADEKVFYEVSKHRFCERCEYFTGPPEVGCTFEGADIVEFLDMETVRLVNCPVVAEHRELGEASGMSSEPDGH